MSERAKMSPHFPQNEEHCPPTERLQYSILPSVCPAEESSNNEEFTTVVHPLFSSPPLPFLKVETKGPWTGKDN